MTRLILLSCILLLAACNTEPEKFELSGETMGTNYAIVAIGPPDDLEIRAVEAAVEKTLRDVNARMSNWDPNSEISRFNQQTSTHPVQISSQLAELIAAANEIHDRSEGQFDVTTAPLIELWGFGARKREDGLPSQAEIKTALSKVGQSRLLSLGRNPDTLRKTRSDTTIYLAAIAKGQGIDALANTLTDLGFENYLVEIGGDLITSGTNARGESWKIGIERPDATNRALEQIIDVSNHGMATSGDYRNFFEENGKRYSHIINAETGYPVDHATASVTVLADSAMLADGWATALLALGHDRGMEIAKDQNLAALFIVRDEDPSGTGFKSIASERFQNLQAGE